MKNDADIDLVYLWVDGNDPAWRARRNALTGTAGEVTATEDCRGRYASNDELRYSLRSVELYAPWIRRIFIVTDGQIPDWLDTSNPRIRIVDHSEIMPPQSRPCFNSNVIEHCIANIPGLSERFIYANDDMFFNRSVTPGFFFRPDGLPVVRLTRRPLRKLVLWYREHILKKPLRHYNLIVHRTAQMVERRLGRYVQGKPHHNIDAYLKSDWQRTHRMFAAEIEATMENHIRCDSDVQRCVYSYAPLVEGRAHASYVTRRTSFRLHIDNHIHYKRLERCRPVLFCMNDSEYADDGDRRVAREYVERRFPQKSSFEL